MEAINFDNYFKEPIADEIIIKDGHAYRRDMLRVVRVLLDENVEEEIQKTFEYKTPKEMIKYIDGKIMVGKDKKSLKELEEKPNGKFNFWTLFEKQPVYSIILQTKQLIELFVVQERMLRVTNQNQYKSYVKFDFENEKIIMYNQEEKEEREKLLKILQKKGTIEQQEISMPFAIVNDYLKSIVDGSDRIRIDFYEQEENKQLIKISNKKKMEIIFAAKQ